MTNDEKCKLVKMWAAGVPTKEIASALLYSCATVNRMVRELGLPRRKHGGKRVCPRKVTPEQVEQMCEMRATGAIYKEIGKRFGISLNSARNYVVYGRNR